MGLNRPRLRVTVERPGVGPLRKRAAIYCLGCAVYCQGPLTVGLTQSELYLREIHASIGVLVAVLTGTRVGAALACAGTASFKAVTEHAVIAVLVVETFNADVLNFIA